MRGHVNDLRCGAEKDGVVGSHASSLFFPHLSPLICFRTSTVAPDDATELVMHKLDFLKSNRHTTISGMVKNRHLRSSRPSITGTGHS